MVEETTKQTNEWLEEIDITGDGGVIKRIFVRGDDEQKPTKGEQVSVHYEGRLESGKVFDKSYDRGPFEVSIGTGQVIKGWDVGIITMGLGEQSELIIKSDYGYGAKGAGADIPGGATLIFKVELLQIGDKKVPTKSDEQILEDTQKLKAQGNAKFGAKQYEEAEKFYNEALSELDNIEEKT